MYASLKSFYRQLMFPTNQYAKQWTPTEIDQLDVHFFDDLMSDLEDKPKQEEVYLSELW